MLGMTRNPFLKGSTPIPPATPSPVSDLMAAPKDTTKKKTKKTSKSKSTARAGAGAAASNKTTKKSSKKRKPRTTRKASLAAATPIYNQTANKAAGRDLLAQISKKGSRKKARTVPGLSS